MAKLVDVYRSDSKPLSRRQLPLVVDETLTMVMDLKNVALISDNQSVKGKELDDISKKMHLLTDTELSDALEIRKSEMLQVLNQAVPCVGCRRSVEQFYYKLIKYGHPTLDPINVKEDGVITIRADKQNSPHFLCSLFHGHSARLNNLVDSQPRRNKKSHRCLLHSLDSQRSRPITPAWRDVWDCMRPECKRDVCIIEAASLHSTLETYLRKHRFCGECRTKVRRAYILLIEGPEPCKEKGYNSALYLGIKRCGPDKNDHDKHIHLQMKTDYIAKLIGRAEPELLGSRRERHAKTLEIAQEEVLTCIGICMYERLHRIYMRMKEEECTCQVFAAVAVDALWRSFETAVESKQGYSQLELLYAELAREEQQKQIRREQKKLKRKRKKEKVAEQDEKENCNEYDEVEDFDECNDLEKCSCSSSKVDKEDDSCDCDELSTSKDADDHNKNDKSIDKSCCTDTDFWITDFKCDASEKKNKKMFKCDNYIHGTDFHKRENGSSSDHSHDCGYSSENNNGCCESGSILSSLPSSPEGSEVACSEGCCQPEQDYMSYSRTSYGNGHQLSLQEMVEDHFYCDDSSDYYITPEEVNEFKTNNRELFETRQQLRETLQKRFAQLCVNGPLQVPRLLVQSRYATN